MDTPHINIKRMPGEFYPNEADDLKWAGEHRMELVDTYGSGVALIYQQQVIGTGKTLQAALEDAERRLPPNSGVVTPVIRLLSRRHPFFRVHPKRVE